MNEYKKLREIGDENGETNDCAVIAIAATCNVSYAESHKAFEKAGRKNRQGATVMQIHAAAQNWVLRCTGATVKMMT